MAPATMSGDRRTNNETKNKQKVQRNKGNKRNTTAKGRKTTKYRRRSGEREGGEGPIHSVRIKQSTILHLAQVIAGDLEGARKTQDTFSKRCGQQTHALHTH